MSYILYKGRDRGCPNPYSWIPGYPACKQRIPDFPIENVHPRFSISFREMALFHNSRIFFPRKIPLFFLSRYLERLVRSRVYLPPFFLSRYLERLVRSRVYLPYPGIPRTPYPLYKIDFWFQVHKTRRNKKATHSCSIFIVVVAVVAATKYFAHDTEEIESNK